MPLTSNEGIPESAALRMACSLERIPPRLMDTESRVSRVCRKCQSVIRSTVGIRRPSSGTPSWICS